MLALLLVVPLLLVVGLTTVVYTRSYPLIRLDPARDYRLDESVAVPASGAVTDADADSTATPLSPPRPLPGPRWRIGLVIAHPDDESMFFVPSLAHLGAQGHSLSILCLSTGNADGLGETRKEELRAAAATLGIPSENVHVVDDQTNLADGMKQRWSVVEARGHIERFVQEQSIDLLLTFDSEGVSGHPNHIATFDAVQSLIRIQPADSRLVAYALESVPLWRKYLGVVDLLPCAWVSTSASRLEWSSDGLSRFCLVRSPLPPLDAMALSFRAMQAHRSQFVWFRRLFVVFSRYTFINTLVRIQGGHAQQRRTRRVPP